MNRESRREMGISKEVSDNYEKLNLPCTILEAVQLAQGVVDDKLSEYHENMNPIIVSLAIQVETLKHFLFKNNVINEEDYISLFDNKVSDYNETRKESLKEMEEISKKVAQNKKYPSTNVTPFPVDTKVDKL